MVLHNPNNWHWVNKDVSEWAREWLQSNLTTIKAEKGDNKATIVKVSSMEGDVDVSQRKGKVITLFDVKLVLDYEGSSGDDQDVSGTITIPEVAHDTEEDEYVFEVSGAGPVRELVRSDLVPQLRKDLQKLGPALISEHGKGIQHAPGTGPPTGYVPKNTQNKVTSSSSAQANAKSSNTTTTSSSKGPSINTVPVTITTEFRTSAEQLYKVFTEVQFITAFTRSPPTVWDGAVPGGKFALFGGNISGSYETLSPSNPTQIKQKWRLAQWPEGHTSSLTLDMAQDDVNGVTNLSAHFGEVPVGEDDSLRQKWGEYYERSLKTTFGFGTIL